jgi:hypothetical protein
VKIAANLAREGSPKVFDQFDIQLANPVANSRDAINHERAPAEVNNRSHQSFVHRHISRAETNYACLVSKSLAEGLADGKRDVFNRVMPIDFQISRAGDFQVEQTMSREQVEHMIEKADAGCDLRITSPIEVDLNLNIGLASRPSFLSGSCH